MIIFRDKIKVDQLYGIQPGRVENDDDFGLHLAVSDSANQSKKTAEYIKAFENSGIHLKVTEKPKGAIWDIYDFYLFIGPKKS